MQVLRDPLFLSAEFLNIRKRDKGSPAISVRVNLQRDDLIYVQSIKGRMEVCGYVDPATGLFMAETEGMDTGSIYHRFRLEAVRFAREELFAFLGRLEGLDEEAYAAKEYKDYPALANGLKNCLVDRQGLYADLQKQVNLIASRKFPKVNEYLVFGDDPEIRYPVSARLPYANPDGAVLSPEGRALVDKFLDVFLDPYNKFVFAWYFGAALLNIPLYDDRVSKLAILSSSLGGSGKSTLVLSMAEALFTPHYRDVKDSFDSFFVLNDRFGTYTLSTKRMCIYSEAAFNADPRSEDHNFSGLNVSSIKSLVTEGYLSTEAKYGDRNMERLSGFHLVLTNHPPMVGPEDRAMNRRILPIMLRPTSMGDKARELKLWGRQKLNAFVKEHAALFAAYFVAAFRENEYAFFEQDYDHRDYIQDIQDSQKDLDDRKRDGRKALDVLKVDGLLTFLEGLEKQEHVELSLLKRDVTDCMGNVAVPELKDHVRLDGGHLYLDSSKSFLLRYGAHGQMVREKFKEFYGEPVKKFHKRMFAIPMGAPAAP